MYFDGCILFYLLMHECFYKMSSYYKWHMLVFKWQKLFFKRSQTLPSTFHTSRGLLLTRTCCTSGRPPRNPRRGKTLKTFPGCPFITCMLEVMLSEHPKIIVCEHSVPIVFTHPKLTVCEHSVPIVFTHPKLTVCEHSVPECSHILSSVCGHSVSRVFTHPMLLCWKTLLFCYIS